MNDEPKRLLTSTDPADKEARMALLAELAEEAEALADAEEVAWMHLAITIPRDDGAALLLHLRDKMGFRDVDFCELQRPDFARATFGPADPRTGHGFAVDPFPKATPDHL